MLSKLGENTPAQGQQQHPSAMCRQVKLYSSTNAQAHTMQTQPVYIVFCIVDPSYSVVCVCVCVCVCVYVYCVYVYTHTHETTCPIKNTCSHPQPINPTNYTQKRTTYACSVYTTNMLTTHATIVKSHNPQEPHTTQGTQSIPHGITQPCKCQQSTNPKHTHAASMVTTSATRIRNTQCTMSISCPL